MLSGGLLLRISEVRILGWEPIMKKKSIKNLDGMTAVEVANYEFSFLNYSEKAVEVRK